MEGEGRRIGVYRNCGVNPPGCTQCLWETSKERLVWLSLGISMLAQEVGFWDIHISTGSNVWDIHIATGSTDQRG